jgi:hypothetical protein
VIWGKGNNAVWRSGGIPTCQQRARASFDCDDPAGAQLTGRSFFRSRCGMILTCKLRAEFAMSANLRSCALLTGRHSS